VTGKLSDRGWWVYLLIFLVLLVVAMVIQGATVHKIGIGPLSVEFDKTKSDGSSNDNSNSFIDFPTKILGGILGGSRDFSRAKSIAGSWKQREGKLTMEITRVENQDGFLRVHVNVINNGATSLVLPLYGGSFTATDNMHKAHDPGLSAWHESIPPNEIVTSTIDLSDKVDDLTTRLDISFSIILGDFAYSDGIAVRGIPIPH
jgi:hypothetical protein